jgi:adenosine deaminase
MRTDVFQPLFEVTKDPTSHPELHVFLQRIVGFDSVDDESKPERRLYRKFPTAKMWNTNQSPPYSYWSAWAFILGNAKLTDEIGYITCMRIWLV